MNGGENKGYTIIEVMLFVAISGFMFVVAAIFINGKQAQVEFRQGMNAVNTTVKTVVNEVANGEYDPLGNYVCTASPGNPPIFQPGTQDQGANGGADGCIFLGKVIQFNVANDGTAYDIYTVTAHQLDGSGAPVTDFLSALPVPVQGGGPDLTVRGKLQDGLQITNMFECTGDCSLSGGGNSRTPIGAFGVFGSFGSSSGLSATAQDSGAQSITTTVIPNVAYGEAESNTVSELPNDLKSITSGNYLASGSYILLCFVNGTKTGSLVIGDTNGQQFSTTVKIGGEATVCAS